MAEALLLLALSLSKLLFVRVKELELALALALVVVVVRGGIEKAWALMMMDTRSSTIGIIVVAIREHGGGLAVGRLFLFLLWDTSILLKLEKKEGPIIQLILRTMNALMMIQSKYEECCGLIPLS